jgi:pimeloyl-ACP methyl ester carboxylesterase
MLRMERTTIGPMMLLTLLLTGAAPTPAAAPSTVWTVIAADPKGDAPEQGVDAAQLAYQYDAQREMVWFRLGTYGGLNAEAFGVTIAMDTGASDTPKTQWWGSNDRFTFDRLVRAQVTRSRAGYNTAIDVGDASRTNQSPPEKMSVSDGAVRVDDRAVVIGVPRGKLLGNGTRMNLIVAIGPDRTGNDEIPNVRSVALDLTTPRPSRGLREIDVSRNNLRFAPGQPTLSDADSPRIAQRGRGRHSLVLIPGVYASAAVFDGFMARNDSAYTFHVVTPPGLSGTPARALPPEGTSHGEFTWTRRLERDILDLIARKHLEKPIIVAHGFPGSLVAEELAVTHPELLGGVLEIAGMPVQPMPTMRDPGRQATPSERVTVVDEAWSQQWFKYVTAETWESNNYPAEMLANDPQRAERARRQIEAAPLPVKIRYLVEYMAWDRRDDFATLGVPLLALIPGFNESLLANPAFAWFRMSFQDSWDGLPSNSRVERIVIPDGRALMLDEQPALTDRAIAAFVERNSDGRTRR